MRESTLSLSLSVHTHTHSHFAYLQYSIFWHTAIAKRMHWKMVNLLWDYCLVLNKMEHWFEKSRRKLELWIWSFRRRLKLYICIWINLFARKLKILSLSFPFSWRCSFFTDINTIIVILSSCDRLRAVQVINVWWWGVLYLGLFCTKRDAYHALYLI